MKKIIFLLMLSATVLAGMPQKAAAQTSLLSNTNGLARDTVTNTGVVVWTTTPFSYTTAITIQCDITKISGTLAGSLTAVVSNDGTTFYAVGSAFTVTDVASQGTTFVPTLGFRYYGVKWTGTGTMQGSLVAKLNKK